MVGKAARPTRKRARRGSLTEDRIVAAALTVLARDGLAGVTMRGVAQELGSAPMSLYRHTPNRGALVELLRRRVMAAPPGRSFGTSHAGWRAVLRELLHGARAQLCRYRGAVALFDSENFRQPEASLAVERALACLAEAGFAPSEASRVAASLWMYTVGSVLAEQSATAAWPGEEIAPAKRARWLQSMQQALGESAPRVSAALPRWAALSHEEVFSKGLELLLAGLDARSA